MASEMTTALGVIYDRCRSSRSTCDEGGREGGGGLGMRKSMAYDGGARAEAMSGHLALQKKRRASLAWQCEFLKNELVVELVRRPPHMHLDLLAAIDDAILKIVERLALEVDDERLLEETHQRHTPYEARGGVVRASEKRGGGGEARRFDLF